MTESSFTPALGRVGSARRYDMVISLTRERLWRGLAAAYVAPRPGELIVDVGCGTGSQALLLARIEPAARIVGIDPDPEVLAIARAKAPDATVEWRQAMGDALTEVVAPGSVDTVVSCLVLHQCPLALKRAILAAGYAVLRPGGRLVVADFGVQPTRLNRAAFRLVQLADGKQNTQPNADGVIPELMDEAGFRDVRRPEAVSTVNGSITIHTARRE